MGVFRIEEIRDKDNEKTCLGVLDRGDRDKDNETGLKEGGVIEMSTTVLPFAMHALFALNTYLACVARLHRLR